MTSSPPEPLRLEPIGRLWQQAWLADVATGGPGRFADWLAGLSDDLGRAVTASWRIDTLVIDQVKRSGETPVVVEPKAGGRCLSADSVLLVETVLADLGPRGVPLEECMTLLGPAVQALSDSEAWPVPAELRTRLESLTARMADELALSGAQVRDGDLLLAVPVDDPGATATDRLDLHLDRVVAACLAVPRAVLASTPSAEPA
jgi:hypothetical protein